VKRFTRRFTNASPAVSQQAQQALAPQLVPQPFQSFKNDSDGNDAITQPQPQNEAGTTIVLL
jgi:hypothetical protein